MGAFHQGAELIVGARDKPRDRAAQVGQPRQHRAVLTKIQTEGAGGVRQPKASFANGQAHLLALAERKDAFLFCSRQDWAIIYVTKQI